MRAVNVLLAILVSLVLGLGIFEIGLCLIGRGPSPSVLEFDPQLGWRKHSEMSVHRKGPEYSVTLATNEFGLADDPMGNNPAKPADTFRVVALGDSFTQGFTVDRKDLFVDLLEKKWKDEGRKADIVNAGCEAYSTDQEVAWLLENGARFQPDLVVLFAYENDLYWNGSPTYIYRDSPKPLFKPDGTLESGVLKDVGPRPWNENWAIALLFQPLFVDAKKFEKYMFVPEGSSKPLNKEFAPLLKKDPDFLRESYDRTRGALIALRNKCAELKARALVVTSPSHSSIDPSYAEQFAKARLPGVAMSAWSADKPVDTFLALAKDAGLETLDPRAFLRERAKDGKDLYFKVDWHLNPHGNAAFAEYLHQELDRLNVFPPDHRAIANAGSAIADIEEAGFPTWPKLFVALWIALSLLYMATYRQENKLLVPLKIGALLAVVFTIAIGGHLLLGLLPMKFQQLFGILLVLGLLCFIAYKLGRRIGTIAELFKTFVFQGHWYLMPLIVVLLSIGSLLVVAASSPFVAPFIYTLF